MLKNGLLATIKRIFAIIICFVIFSGTFIYVPNTTAGAANIKDFFNNIFGNTTQTQQCEMPQVYVGGIPLGFTLECKGVVVIAVGKVHTDSGVVNTIINGSIVAGDIITHIQETPITSVKIIENLMDKQGSNNKQVDLVIIDKNNQQKTATILPAKDIITCKYKLGLWVRDNSAGVGTLTYIQQENSRFGALGHSVCDIDTGAKLPLLRGDVYKCNIIGVQPSKKGTAGELKGLFLKNGTKIGGVDKNLDCGVFGVADKALINLLKKDMVSVASKQQVKTGRATIICCINGSQPQEFDIEIIKMSRYSKDDNKSMVIRITDTKLIEQTGGIVQGMSGSPILQNGMLVGAVTHVFINDPTKGYGIFAQTMIEKDL